jgi:hypothetical protein
MGFVEKMAKNTLAMEGSGICPENVDRPTTSSSPPPLEEVTTCLSAALPLYEFERRMDKGG